MDSVKSCEVSLLALDEHICRRVKISVRVRSGLENNSSPHQCQPLSHPIANKESRALVEEFKSQTGLWVYSGDR